MSKKTWATSEDDKIEYISLTKDRLAEAIQVMKIAFFQFENICTAVGLSRKPQAANEVCENMITDIAKHGVSIVAVDKETGKIVGVNLNKIQHKSISTKEMYEEYIKMAKYEETVALFEYLIECEDKVDPFTKYGADCMMEFVFLAVLPEYGRRGIAVKLCEVTIELATQLYKGNNVKTPLDDNPLPLEPRPQFVAAEFTSFKSQKIGRKLDFDILKEVSYEDMYIKEKTYASIIEDGSKTFTIEAKKLL